MVALAGQPLGVRRWEPFPGRPAGTRGTDACRTEVARGHCSSRIFNPWIDEILVRFVDELPRAGMRRLFKDVSMSRWLPDLKRSRRPRSLDQRRIRYAFTLLVAV